ncbi:hypothetical protein F941_03058 [Acinetobacter bouvetii DSM 14964 = CIP 107468]|uniref:Type II secretion system protein H n=1 Tax=Acinetobacter bouvetii DSM 14964 = CIP 107468 TaxID=1120925 RepID=N9DL88_9GAMM|nr:GspH/FimT family pseudopilin [Acinetobacter bouvetii]ENV81500.1 hypothetical protein F941_03058 [Acinetobacter bouvetii DSM 14964 = CIP 107468]BCU63518.1 hypothetical protein ACBO_03090 [Acinetobacter bouvetii]
MRGDNGFTLIELIITMAVLAIIAAMAAPSMNNLLLSQNLNKSTQTMVSVLNEARAQAVLTRQDVTVNLSIDPVSPTSDQLAKMKQKTLFGWSPSGKSALKAAVNPIVFDMTGKLSSSTADIKIEVCNEASGKKSKVITISRIGAIQRVIEGTC